MNAKLCKAIRSNMRADWRERKYVGELVEKKRLDVDGTVKSYLQTGTITLHPHCGKALYKKLKQQWKEDHHDTQ